MFTTIQSSELRRTVAAIACTIVLSATCVLSAVAPAEAGRLHGSSPAQSIAAAPNA